MAMRWINDAAPLQQGQDSLKPRITGLAACLALLELEARALGHPLAAVLLAAAGEDLRGRATDPGISAAECPPPG